MTSFSQTRHWHDDLRLLRGGGRPQRIGEPAHRRPGASDRPAAGAADSELARAADIVQRLGAEPSIGIVTIPAAVLPGEKGD
jgi:hypothetical protein